MNKQLVVVISVGVLLLFGLSLSSRSSSNSSSSPVSATAAPTHVQEPTALPGVGMQKVLSGTYICLPHKDTSGPQTDECAVGIKADDGLNYALSLGASLAPQFQAGKLVTVEGHVVPIEAISSLQWHKYNIKGIMQVEEIR